MSDMIFDRTLDDVNKAKTIRDNKVKTFQPLTEDDKGWLERGLMTINTVTRIEEKQEDLRGIFNDMGYFNTSITNKSWRAEDIFDETEFQRIVDNDRVLKEAFFIYAGTPETPTAEYHFENINALEKILFDLDVMINDIKSRYRECGAFECGEDDFNG